MREFKALYYQRKASRIRFVQHSIHLLTHIAPETIRAGPLTCYAQWTMETAIGNLGKEIRQDKDPYRNLEERGVLRAQINSLMAMYLSLDINYGLHGLPTHAHGFPNGYAFLPQRDTTARPMAPLEYIALMEYWEREGWPNQTSWPNAIFCWGQLKLPNGQRARSVWSESNSKSSLRRTSCIEVSCPFCCERSLKAILDQLQWEHACIKCFILLLHTVWRAAIPSRRRQPILSPDESLLSQSNQTIYLCSALEGQEAICVVPVTSIKSVVSMFPDLKVTSDGELVNTQRFALLRHPFLELAKYNTEGLLDEEDDDTDIVMIE